MRAIEKRATLQILGYSPGMCDAVALKVLKGLPDETVHKKSPKTPFFLSPSLTWTKNLGFGKTWFVLPHLGIN